jgi:hypothetical protein
MDKNHILQCYTNPNNKYDIIRCMKEGCKAEHKNYGKPYIKIEKKIDGIIKYYDLNRNEVAKYSKDAHTIITSITF